MDGVLISTCLAACLLLGQATNEAKSNPIQADRPDFTNGSDTVDRGKLQFEGGVSYARIGDLKTTAIGEGEFRYGLTDRFELHLNVNSFRWLSGGDSGFEDMGPGFKWKLYESKRRGLPSIGIGNDTTFPTGSSAFRENTLQPLTRLAFDWDLTESLGLGVNLGWANLSDGGQRFTQYFASASFDITLHEPLHAYAELYTLAPSGHAGRNLTTADGGFTYRLDNNTAVDIHGGVGLGGDKPNYLIGAGIALRW